MYQKIIIVGNLGRDPEMRYTPSGQAVTSFSVATNRQYTTSSGEKVKETTWFRISVWGRMAEVCNQYLRRGSKVLIEGRLRPDPATGGPRTWTGNDGIVRASFEINADVVRFLSSRNESMDANTPAPASGADLPLPPDDDIPF